MGVSVGEIVTLKVTEVAGYACWGVLDGQIGFVHCVEWSWKKPIPENQEPHVGDEIRVKVIHLTDCPYDQLLADVTFEGKFKVDFAASIRLLHPEDNPWHDPNAYQVGGVFTGRLEEVHSFGCWVRHPLGVDGRLLVDGVAHNFQIGQQVKVRIVAVNPQKESLDVALYPSEELA
jgi:ribosomal protein S1